MVFSYNVILVLQLRNSVTSARPTIFAAFRLETNIFGTFPSQCVTILQLPVAPISGSCHQPAVVSGVNRAQVKIGLVEREGDAKSAHYTELSK